MSNNELPIGDTVEAAGAFAAIDATISKYFAGRDAAVVYTIDRGAAQMTKTQAEAWVEDACTDGCSLVRYAVYGLKIPIVVDLVAIEPLSRVEWP